MRPVFGFLGLAAIGLAASGSPVFAGTFSTPHFIEVGNSAIGFEPEVVLTSGAGVGANLRYTYGLTDFNNLTALIGTGTGPRRFRFGGNMSFDFFPDVDKQPGIGLATQAILVRLVNSSQLEVTAVPYIHKTFITGNSEVEPYVSIPFGLGFSEGHYQALTSFSVGSMFKGQGKIATVIEFGIAVNHTDTYVSGGVVYYP